jgi:dihydroorotate dehydrogenase (fumarate)/dihydroorotate dehydrogenase
MKAYRTTVRPLLFRMDAEAVHAFAIRSAEIASASASACAFARSCYAFRSDRLAVTVAGMQMDSPLGLAAGFDKSARGVDFLASLGFGHVEVGSISADPSDGNPQPRLFRIPRDRAIVVNYGLPNDGADAVARRLSRRGPAATLGINVVSTNRGPHAPRETDDAVIEDYLRSVAKLEPFASY